MNKKEQWDYVGKELLPKEENILAYRDVYGVWINPFTEERKLILIEDKGADRK